jgi:peptidoglycan/xylan/chitin deacetylase (PgdA/CDA1 family)
LPAQLRYLRHHYRLLPLGTALDELFDCSGAESSRRQDTRTRLALTFDDGYHDNFTHAFALAREMCIPLTIFLVPGYIESGDYFWWLEASRLVQRAQVTEVSCEGRTFRLNDASSRSALTRTIDTRLRYASSVDERDAVLATVRSALKIPCSLTTEEVPARPLTWTEVREMEASGWISFGAHTMNHPVLACLRNRAEVAWEVTECRKVIERQLGHSVDVFAYPFGEPEHIGHPALQAVSTAGYHTAVAGIRGSNTPRTNPYLLRRIGADANDHWLVVAARATGVWGFVFRPKGRTRLPRVGRRRGSEPTPDLSVITHAI